MVILNEIDSIRADPYNDITIKECMLMYKHLHKCVIISSGKIIGFNKEESGEIVNEI